jgi:hypothetical protein
MAPPHTCPQLRPTVIHGYALLSSTATPHCPPLSSTPALRYASHLIPIPRVAAVHGCVYAAVHGHLRLTLRVRNNTAERRAYVGGYVRASCVLCARETWAEKALEMANQNMVSAYEMFL